LHTKANTDKIVDLTILNGDATTKTIQEYYNDAIFKFSSAAESLKNSSYEDLHIINFEEDHTGDPETFLN